MSATLTIGKRRARSPSESGSTCPVSHAASRPGSERMLTRYMAPGLLVDRPLHQLAASALTARELALSQISRPY